MAKKLGLSESHISLMVSGRRRMTMDYAAVFANELDVSIDEIFLAIDFAKRKVIADTDTAQGA
jgi:plasmid maintenance system antidote protein VapI